MNLKPRAQERAWNTLLALSKALPQGLILIGPSGVGKRRAAKALYQWIHCVAKATTEDSQPCGQCPSCRKIAEGKHVDLIEISPRGESIAVEDLREMKKNLFFSPMEGKIRFVIIDEAHKLNSFSANTLLKTLEEPPAHTRFFLITPERGLLLPTIVSRCQFVHFSPLTHAALKHLLAELQIELPPKLLSICLDLLGGGLGRASLLATEKAQSFLEMAQNAIESGAQSWDKVTELADQLASAAASSQNPTAGVDSADWKLELFLDLLVRIGHSHATANNDSIPSAARLVSLASYLRRRLDRHANKKLVALAAADLTFANPNFGGCQR